MISRHALAQPMRSFEVSRARVNSLQGDPQSGIVEWLQRKGNLQQGTCFNPRATSLKSRGEPSPAFFISVR
jgi:hypothetical protein